MPSRFGTLSMIAVLLQLASRSVPAPADDSVRQPVEGTTPAPDGAKKAVKRGLAFLQADAARWRAERKCASCHHGTMTVWALSEARSRGYPVDDETFRDLTDWARERLANIDKPRDTRPGWSMVNTPAVYMALMALAVPTQDAISPDASYTGSRAISCGTRKPTGPGPGPRRPPRTGRRRSSSRTKW
jgi:hypothetical protein